MKLLGRVPWDANLRHYSGYDQAEILPTAQFMLDYILRSGCKNLGMGLDPNFVIQASYEGGNEHANLFKKYATRKFFRVSEIVRDWAVDRYTFETPTGYECDKLEEWSSSSKTAKKRATTAGAQRAARRIMMTLTFPTSSRTTTTDAPVPLFNDSHFLFFHLPPHTLITHRRSAVLTPSPS
ncbi:hypothetical protein PtA15_13A452 [Puccinia triticina]|uniref:Uncharacterized protein n=1 Tax=Puccinia triticina TaxID=208348 RepID=A0ABY7D0W2_9BASI|nr:uncharacterized protein PtA15_13A452 [Puccinia triticina]WAQ91051.1 hypothetical protein PtA15_13A452 [Puccinia triticina]WAR61244.1 hypothetical protein PtB15_13B497 [Puccinia triticina]